jgi:hypothetical protein
VFALEELDDFFLRGGRLRVRGFEGGFGGLDGGVPGFDELFCEID